MALVVAVTLVNEPGKVVGRLIRPQPWELTASAGVEIVAVADGAGAVDQQGLHEGGAVGAVQSLLEELLHQGQRA